VKLQSVDLRVPDVEATARFFAEVWGLERVQGNRLRGTAALPYLVGLEQGPPAITPSTFCGGKEREVKGPEGELYRFVAEQRVDPLAASRDRPIRLSHVVLNSSRRWCRERPRGFHR
jgi:catechol 2,3-dioxygenase-like lactoylglutathione lyase family enzyme